MSKVSNLKPQVGNLYIYIYICKCTKATITSVTFYTLSYKIKQHLWKQV